MIDLHIHTVYSDGSMTPEEIVNDAKSLGLTHIAITDHDTLSAVEQSDYYAKSIAGPEVIPGIEFSCFYGGEDIHILAYFIPIHNTVLNDFLGIIHKKREERFIEQIHKLASLGFPISPEDVNSYGPGGMKMCPQIVKVLHDKGIIPDHSKARLFIREYLSPGGKAHVIHDNNPLEIINFCHSLGTITSLSHPHKLKNLSIISDIVSMGIMGLEFYYPNVPKEKRKHVKKMIAQKGLLATGGSDFHGIYTDSRLGDGNVPLEVMSNLKSALDKIRNI